MKVGTASSVSAVVASVARCSLALVASLAGCSIAELPRPRRTEPADCPWGHVTADAIATAGLGVTGAFLLTTAEPGHDWLGLPRDLLQKTIGVSLVVVAVVDAASTMYGLDIARACEAKNVEVARVRTQRDAVFAQRQRAWTLTTEAATAARAGDCAQVTALDAQVRSVDADFHATVFVRDAAIARCLAATP